MAERMSRPIVDWMPDTRQPVAPDREPSRMHVALGILGCICAALALFSAVLG